MLQSIADSGTFPTEATDRLAAGNSLRLGVDLCAVAHALRKGLPLGLREVVAIAFKGSLSDTGGTRALQAQSSLLAGAIIAASGREVSVPIPGRSRSPDYIFQVDTAEFALEVKRPSGLKRIDKTLEGAIEQIEAFRNSIHAIFLDVTDCITWASDSPSTRDEATTTLSEVVRQADIIVGHAVSSHPEKFQRLAVLCVSAAPILWLSGSPTAPALFQSTIFTVYEKACSGLVLDHSRRCVDALLAGYRVLGALSVRDL